MAEKRYYWLKLKDDFFDSIRIKKLRSLAGGDTYTIIYLKMLLKAIKNDGVLEYQGVEQNICDEIALDINESPDNVNVALTYLLSCGLAEQEYNDCLLPEAIELVGSEQESAERVRNYRERQKQRALQCNTDVTQVKRLCNTEIEKREKREEIEKREKIQYFPFPEVEDAFQEFLKIRKKLKAVNSDRAINSLVSKINEYSNGNPNEAVKIIEQSIENSWKGIFPLKGSKQQTSSSQLDAIMNA